MKQKATVSLISRDESSALKGLLILLIVIGHLRGALLDELKEYLYCFHVQCFFILPFLYPSKKLTRDNVVNLVLKLLWPFWLLYAIQIVIAVALFHISSFTEGETLLRGVPNTLLGIWSFFTGGITLIDKFCGTQFLWFLPCFLSMSIIRMWWQGSSRAKFLTIIPMLLGLGCFVFYSVFAYRPFLLEDFYIISEAVSPFSLWQGLGYFVLGSCVSYIIRSIKFHPPYLYWILVVVVTVLFFLFNSNQWVFRTSRFLFPAIFFMALYGSRGFLARFYMLEKVGRYSLAIYLIHPFLCMAAGMLTPPSYGNNIGVLGLQFIVITAMSYAIAVAIEKITPLRRIIFPRGEEIGLIRR